jgi:hypothetical protein
LAAAAALGQRIPKWPPRRSPRGRQGAGASPTPLSPVRGESPKASCLRQELEPEAEDWLPGSLLEGQLKVS